MSRNANYDFAEHAKSLLRKEKPTTKGAQQQRSETTKTARSFYHPEVYGALKDAVAAKLKGYKKDV